MKIFLIIFSLLNVISSSSQTRTKQQINKYRIVLPPPAGCVVDSSGLAKEFELIKGFFWDECVIYIPKRITVEIVESFPDNAIQKSNHHMTKERGINSHYIDVLNTDNLSILRYRMMFAFTAAVLRDKMSIEILNQGGIIDESGICEYISYLYIKEITPESTDKIFNTIQKNGQVNAFMRVKESNKSICDLLEY